jgi:uncharacterized protein YecT (DUF1311 family)
LIGIAILAAASVAAAPAPAPKLHCPGDSTPEINDCRAAELAKAEAELARYLAEARKRLKADGADDPGSAAALAGLDKTETAWKAYREAQCDAVYDYWQAGTIRTVMALNCEIDLTRQHTHTVWSNWLTYMDSTPPILPEPSTKPAP